LNPLTLISQHLTAVALMVPAATVLWDTCLQAALKNVRHRRRFGYSVHLAGFGLFIGAVLRATGGASDIVVSAFIFALLTGAMLPINSVLIREESDGSLWWASGPKWSRMIGVGSYAASVYLYHCLSALSSR
jgi:hypothetical protein